MLKRCDPLKVFGKFMHQFYSSYRERQSPVHALYCPFPGIHYILKKQGLLTSERCLDPYEILSPKQTELLERIRREYPWMIDDEFVSDHIEEWLT